MNKRMRLDKLLAHCGFGTRSEIRKAVKQGRVKVEGQAVKDSGMQVNPDGQAITWDEQPVHYQAHVYLMLNKPPGVISATEDTREQTVIDLLSPTDRLAKPFPVGRLDKDTVGLLLLTNDGQLAHALLSPRKHVDKTYVAQVQGRVDDQDGTAFLKGVALDDGYVTRPARMRIREVVCQRDGSWQSVVELTIQEGKFHQVKRMFAAVGKTVIHLQRITMGPLQLDGALAPGEYRPLTEQELAELLAHLPGRD